MTGWGREAEFIRIRIHRIVEIYRIVTMRCIVLWIDEAPMNLYELLGFQPKGVNALSFSSR